MPPAFVKVSIPDKEKQLQQEHQQDKELRHLCREYTSLDKELANHLTTTNGFPKLSKITRIVNIFQSEYENILIDLAVAASNGNVRKDNIQNDRLQDLIQNYADQNEQVKARRTQMLELENEISNTAKSLQSMKKHEITQHQYQDYIHGARQTLERLENQLETQMKKFNTIVGKNAQLRDELDHLMADRKTFINIWERLIRKLTTGKHIMLDLIQQATLAYDQRDECCNKLQLLRMTGHRDYLSNIDKMRSYNSRVDKMLKLVDFFDTKDQKRVMADLFRKETIRRTELEKTLEKKLDYYRNMVTDIQKFTNESKIELIANNYYIREADNFSKFNYVIDLIKEMEEGSDQLTYLLSSIDQQKKLHVQRVDQQKKCLEELDIQLENEKEETRKNQAELDQLDKYLNEMMGGIMKLFKMCKCNQDPVLKLLGDHSTIKDYNVLMYCRILEEAIHRYLIQGALKVKLPERKISSTNQIFTDDKFAFKIYSIDKIVIDTPCSLCAQHEIMSDIIDKVERPVNKAEALEILNQRLELPNGDAIVHRLSKCHLPAARQIMQKAYQ